MSSLNQESAVSQDSFSARLLTGGRCTAGFAKTRLEIDDDYAMAGHSWGGEIGRNGADQLWARAIYLRGAENSHEECVLCAVDLLTGSLALWAFVGELLADVIDIRRVVLAGTHTHTAPGNYFGNSFYDLFAQNNPKAPKEHRGFQEQLTRQLAANIADAILHAKQQAQPSVVGIAESRLWQVSRNRSYPAFEKNHPEGRHWNSPGSPGYPLPDQPLHELEQAIDPRLTAVVLFDENRTAPKAVLATFGCHPTALGKKIHEYSRDWPGITVDELEKAHPGMQAAVACSPAGDATPLPYDDDDATSQGPSLVQDRGRKIAEAALAAIEAARNAPLDPLAIHVAAGDWVPKDEPGGTWEIGWPVLAGAEDGRSPLYPKFAREGMRRWIPWPPMHQFPKRSAAGILQRMVVRAGLIDLAPHHPWNRIQIGSHILVTVPGEASTVAGYRIEQAVIDTSAIHGATATVITNAGDYLGYFTTPEEYHTQQYEGAHTLYGKFTLARLTVAVLQRGVMPTPPPSIQRTAWADDIPEDASWEEIVERLVR